MELRKLFLEGRNVWQISQCCTKFTGSLLPPILALVHLSHKMNQVMDAPDKVIRIIFLDFRKAFDPIDHNVLLENCCKIGVRPALISWLRLI